MSQTIATTVGLTYTLSFWLENEGPGVNNFTATWDGQTELSLTNASAFGYTEYTNTVTATSSTSTLEFSAVGSPWLLDNISLTETVPTPPVISTGLENSNQTVTSTGTPPDGSTVTVWDAGSTALGTATASSTGAWSFTTGDLSAGSYSFAATDQTTSTASSPLSLTVTATPVISTGVEISDQSVTLTGIAPDGATVTVYELTTSSGATTALGTATASSAGAWSFTTAALSTGIHDFTATQTTSAGASSPLVVGVSATPVTYYVSSETGNNHNAGTSASAPLATLQEAADLVQPGDVVEVMNGTYAPVYISTSGTASAPITFEAAPGQTPVINSSGIWYGINTPASYIIVDGFTVVGDAANYTLAQALAGYSTGNPSLDGNGIDVEGNHVTIENNTVYDEPGNGIATAYADYVQILNNVVYDNAWWSAFGNSGISIWESVNSDTNAGIHDIVSGNLVFGNANLVPNNATGTITDGEGIILDTNPNFVGEILVENNTTYQNGSAGIESNYTPNAVITENISYLNNVGNIQWASNAEILIYQSNNNTVTANSTTAPELTPPAAPVISSDTVNGISGPTTVTLNGTAEAYSTVTVYDNSTQLGTATANGRGGWTFTTAPLADGSESFTATATDSVGNVSPLSSPLVTVTTQIDQTYQAVLQHAPTTAEVNASLSIEATFGTGGMIAAIIVSPEAQQNVYPVIQIIDLATGSLPTAAQLSGWVPYVESAGLLQSQSQTNPLLDQMAEAFVASSQFGDMYNGGTAVDPNAPITASIAAAVIQAATGVAATQAQINAWVDTGLTIDQVFVYFALGDPYSAYLQSTVQQYLTTLPIQAVSNGALNFGSTITLSDGLNAAQVQAAYQAVLQRPPTSEETNAALSIDGSSGNVPSLAVIVDSPEAQYNVYPIVQIIDLATGSLPTGAQLSGWLPFVESAGLLQSQSQTNPLLDQIAEAFVASSQFGDMYNGGTAVDPNAPITASLVSAIIQAALGTAATQVQINAWVASGLTISQVFADFALGDQYAVALQSAVQDDLTAAAINGAGLSNVDGINATGALTLGTVQTPLTGNDLTVQGGSGSLTVVASGDGDTIVELNASTAGGTITASGNNDIINVANGANTITANGPDDTITLGVVSTGTSITAVQTVHAAGAGDVITFATHAVDGTPVSWAGASTVDGGNGSIGIGAHSTVNFGTNTGGGSETVVVTGDLTGATTSGGSSTTGIAMITLGNVVDGGGDQIVFNNATTEVLAGTGAVNVTSAASLAQAFDMAASAAATSQSGAKIGAETGVIDWFQYGGNTYVLEAINDTGTSAPHSALAATDEAIKIIGVVNLGGESLVGHTLAL